MPAKSILEIEVKDDAFKRFSDLFKKYQESLGETAAQWGDAGAAIEMAGATMAAQTAGLLIQNQLVREQQKAWEKQEKQEKSLLDAENRRKRVIHDIWLDTQKIGKNIVSTTESLLRWVGIGSILSGLAGAGGLWGLDALAHGVTERARQAGGLGLTVGEQREANIQFGPYVGVNSALEGIASAKSDMSKWWMFNAAGMGNWQNRNPAQMLPDLMLRAHDLWAQGYRTTNQPQIQALLGLGLSMDDIRNLGQQRRADLVQAKQQYYADKAQVDLTNQTNALWRHFSVTLMQAEGNIQAAFITALTPLTPALTHLSEVVVGVITKLSKNGTLDHWMTLFGYGIENLATAISKPSFEKNINAFITDIGLIADKLVKVLKLLDIIPDNAPKSGPPPAKMGDTNARVNPGGYYTWDILGHRHWHKPDKPLFDFTFPWETKPAAPRSGFSSSPSFSGRTAADLGGLTPGTNKSLMDSVLWGIYGAESSFGRNPAWHMERAGSVSGPFQILDKTGLNYGLNPSDRMDYAKSRATAAMILTDLLKEFHGNMRMAIAGYNENPTAVEAAVRKYGRDWENHLARGVKVYVESVVKIANSTGANLNTQSAQLVQ